MSTPDHRSSLERYIRSADAFETDLKGLDVNEPVPDQARRKGSTKGDSVHGYVRRADPFADRKDAS